MVYNWRGPRSDTTSFVKMAWGVLQVRTTIENCSQEKLKKKGPRYFNYFHTRAQEVYQLQSWE